MDFGSNSGFRRMDLQSQNRSNTSSIRPLLGLAFLLALVLLGVTIVVAAAVYKFYPYYDPEPEFEEYGRTLNNRPVIGILSQEYYENGNYEAPSLSYIAASYVKYVEGGGARVVPIMINQTIEYYEKIFQEINGLLFPGGGVYFNESAYATAGKILLDMARKANDKGDYFPVWGTCLGFEFLIYDALGGEDVLANCNAYNVTNKLEFTEDSSRSRLFGKTPRSMLKILSTKPVTSNFHTRCLTEETITKYKTLEKTFRFLSWNMDSGMPYVSSLESRSYPIYGVQFHPEKNMYEWSWKKNIPHSNEAILAGQYFAQFLINEARKSSHKFGEELVQALIYNYPVNYTGGVTGAGVFEQNYFFPL